MNVIDKAEHFLVALTDVYRDEEERNLGMIPPLSEEEITEEDFTAMLIAMKVLFEEVTGTDEADDLIGFTHILNRLAIQYAMESKEEHHCCSGHCKCNHENEELASAAPTILQ
jgi:hypothetical protein